MGPLRTNDENAKFSVNGTLHKYERTVVIDRTFCLLRISFRFLFRKYHLLSCLHEEAEDGPEAQLHQHPQMPRSL